MQASFFLGRRGRQPPFGGSTFGVTSFTCNVIWQWRTCFEKWGKTGYTLEQALIEPIIHLKRTVAHPIYIGLADVFRGGNEPYHRVHSTFTHYQCHLEWTEPFHSYISYYQLVLVHLLHFIIIQPHQRDSHSRPI